MRALLPTTATLPLFDVAASRRIEARALVHSPDLMERAGLAVAKLALATRRGDGPVWVACGPGNNGGDGRVAARRLAEAGVPVHIGNEAPTHPSLAIDALLGLGLNRAPTAAMLATFAALQACGAPILAVDLPSGLLADTGQPAGARAVRADHTLTLLTLKPGLFTGEGRTHCGRIWFDDLGIAPDEPATADLLGPSPAPARSPTSHKGSHGQVVVVGGAPGMQGAARLAARAALASGAGRVYAELLGVADDEPADPGRPELMRGRATVLPQAVGVVGCGAGARIADALPHLLKALPRLVIDADALNAIAAEPALHGLLRARPVGSTVLTPHPLEAARLLGRDTAALQADRLGAARELADRLACTVVLKGSGSVIASPRERPALCASGGPALATAGSGDVLAGWLGGLWAQQPDASAHAIACAGVDTHARAGEVPGVLRAGDLVERLAGHA
ncbi:NAD(P)H-hydrate dehydratase [Pelomonas sp. P7]|uniref:Bifunctional NAD(P)H-hydrate repair enzyme n=1 Tax=Pelomonas caseinilytica TaxID=2906763 RepID=A0ABS8XBY3_9BURK|nr:NAD(P)H-hydrate dehydratase [Pelomonas sp. P7]MCE4536068.1 NAD(P)H-hydrate dehydratase [Pelomonas sp. P7]